MSIPWKIAPVRSPAKIAFSQKYKEYGICGALGLSDQGLAEESDIGQAGVGWTRGELRGREMSWEGEEGSSGYKCLRVQFGVV